mgnify:CR=1 FL=1
MYMNYETKLWLLEPLRYPHIVLRHHMLTVNQEGSGHHACSSDDLAEGRQTHAV